MNSTATTDTKPIDERITAAIERQLPDLRAIYQFGSTGTRYERADSDLDLAVLTEQPHDPVTVWDLAQYLATIVDRDVDLVDLRRASTVMAAQIIDQGQRILCLDGAGADAFEAHTLADYARLGDVRQSIIDDFEARHGV